MHQRSFHSHHPFTQYNPFFIEISLVFVFLPVRSDTAVPGQLSLFYDSVSLRAAYVVDKGRRTILLVGVGLYFGTLPIVDLPFATIGLVFAELGVMSAFAWTHTLVEVVVGTDIRGTLKGVVAVFLQN